MRQLTVIAAAAWTTCVASVEALPIVRTDRGLVSGVEETSRAGKSYMAFRKIPYAKPPLGNLRFARPQVMSEWDDILDASQDPQPCIQIDLFALKPGKPAPIYGQEDCLYISIFTGNLTGKLPVLVFIHGGGFESWTGATMHGPEYLMDHNLVYVSFNYRLGPLGFLSFENDELPGNYGMHDQVAALQWVHREIGAFGGDASKVTVAGESAGAVSVHMHTKSALSRALSSENIDQLDLEFNKLAPVTFDYSMTNSAPEVFNNIRHFYFGTENIRKGTNLTNLYTDSWFAMGFYQLFAAHKGPLYPYYVKRAPTISFIQMMGNTIPPGVSGASHGDDLLYLFNGTRANLAPLNEADLIASQALVRLWTDFVITGEPSEFSKGPSGGKGWRITLNEDSKLVIETDDDLQFRVRFWDKISHRLNAGRRPL